MVTSTTRRGLLRQISFFAASSALLPSTVCPSHADDAATDPQLVEQWMDTWMKSNKATQGALIVGRFADPIYFLYKPITWTPNKGQEQLPTITAPTGFVTDLASVPRAFWSALRPDGLYAYAAIIHDYLYWTQTTTKDAADTILKLAMEEFNVDGVTVSAIYHAVSLFGGTPWDNNKRLKASGERRILKQFPEDPKTTWDEWKKKDVFK